MHTCAFINNNDDYQMINLNEHNKDCPQKCTRVHFGYRHNNNDYQLN